MWLYFLSDVSFISIKPNFSGFSIPALRNSRLPGPMDPEQKDGTEKTSGDACRGTSTKDQV